MSRTLNKLTAKQVEACRRKRGLWSDGGNLFLKSDGAGRFSWLLIYKSPTTGRQRSLGLGSAAAGHVTLEDARRRAVAAREHLKAKRDPIEQKQAERAQRHAEAKAAHVPTFGELADAYLVTHRADWSNPKHASQWEHGLTVHAAALRSMPVNTIMMQHVRSVLAEIWDRFPETAQRLRARIANVLDSARADGWITANVAEWDGLLEHKLSAQKKLTRGHHPSLSYSEMPAFMARLMAEASVSAKLLRLIILNASRQGEMRGLRWSEIDLDRRLITIPAARMKMKQAHTIPLSDAACDVLRDMIELREEGNDLVFVSHRGKPFSDAATAKILARIGYGHITTHGMRSSFRTWSAERTETPYECAEMCLAHNVASVVARAYLRSDLLEKRRAHMNAWAMHCAGFFEPVNALFGGLAVALGRTQSNVVRFQRAA